MDGQTGQKLYVPDPSMQGIKNIVKDPYTPTILKNVLSLFLDLEAFECYTAFAAFKFTNLGEKDKGCAWKCLVNTNPVGRAIDCSSVSPKLVFLFLFSFSIFFFKFNQQSITI